MNPRHDTDTPTHTKPIGEAPPLARILLVDDHALFRQGVALLLREQTSPRLDITEAGCLADALAIARQLAPDVVLLDVRMLGTSGLEGLAAMRAACPDARIALLTGSVDPIAANDPRLKQANGYISKASDADNLVRQIQSLLAGHDSFEFGQVTATVAAAARQAGLTPRQLEVLHFLASGASNKVIAQRLFLSDHTVRSHVTAIFTLLGCDNRTRAVHLARMRGLLE